MQSPVQTLHRIVHEPIDLGDLATERLHLFVTFVEHAFGEVPVPVPSVYVPMVAIRRVAVLRTLAEPGVTRSGAWGNKYTNPRRFTLRGHWTIGCCVRFAWLGRRVKLTDRSGCGTL